MEITNEKRERDRLHSFTLPSMILPILSLSNPVILSELEGM